MSGDGDLGPCDGCGEPIGARGWMRDTGETFTLDDGIQLPWWKFFCSETCSKEDTDD